MSKEVVKYTPIKVGYYFGTHLWPWAVVAAIVTTWIGIDFTDSMDWGDSPESNGHWSAISVVLLLWWIANAFALFITPLIDVEDSHLWDYQRKVRDSKWNGRHEKIVAKAEGDEVNIYKITSGLDGRNEQLLRRFDVVEDLEATDKAIEAAAQLRSQLKERKRIEKEKDKPHDEAARLARIINKA
jgi:hypothetical protein